MHAPKRLIDITRPLGHGNSRWIFGKIDARGIRASIQKIAWLEADVRWRRGSEMGLLAEVAKGEHPTTDPKGEGKGGDRNGRTPAEESSKNALAAARVPVRAAWNSNRSDASARK